MRTEKGSDPSAKTVVDPVPSQNSAGKANPAASRGARVGEIFAAVRIDLAVVTNLLELPGFMHAPTRRAGHFRVSPLSTCGFLTKVNNVEDVAYVIADVVARVLPRKLQERYDLRQLKNEERD